MKKAEDHRIAVEIAKELPERARNSGRKTSRIVAFEDEEPGFGEGTRTNDAGGTKKSATKRAGGGKNTSGGGHASQDSKASAKRAKAKKPNEKISPASIFKKLIAFGKNYQIENEQDFLEAARIYAEEAGLIDQMRDRLEEDGLTVLKTYKTGDVEVAHPLLSELPRHVESANRCLTTIGSMISDRGEKKKRPKRDLDSFRLH